MEIKEKRKKEKNSLKQLALRLKKNFKVVCFIRLKTIYLTHNN